MKRSLQIVSIFIMLTLGTVVSAQVSVPCGIVDIDGPAYVSSGEPLVFKVKVNNTAKPEFKWSVSAGTIIKGQGTDEITVDTNGLVSTDVIATVELTDAPSGCKNSASKTTQIIIVDFIGRFDEYGDLKFEDEKARLDNFAIQLSSDPQLIGIILMVAGQKTFEREAAERLDRVRSYLVNVRGIESSRIITTDCGFSRDLTLKFWILPSGTTPPNCDRIDQISRSEVKFTKPRPKSSKKRR